MSEGGVSIRVLGSVSVAAEPGSAPVHVPGVLPRGFLAALVVEAGFPVSIDRLTLLLWDNAAPVGVKPALQQLATRVRRALAPAGLEGAVRAVSPGYVLDVPLQRTDLGRFRALAATAREAHTAGDLEATILSASAALSHWRGPALHDLAELPMAALLGPVLDDERWRLEELRAAALISAGRPDDAAARLAPATVAEPLRERLWVLRATALAEAGRLAEAVSCARQGITVVTARLGLPPGPELAEIEGRLSRRTEAAPLPTTPHRGTAARQSLVEQALRQALENAARAAEAATARGAHGEAVHQWERAQAIVAELAFDDGGEQRLRVLLGLGGAHNAGGQEHEARAVFTEALGLARARGDACGVAWAVLGYCADRVIFSPDPDDAALLEEALAGLDDTEGLLRGRVLARLATHLYWTESAERTNELARAALGHATAAGDAEGRLQAINALIFGSWTPGRSHALLQLSEHYLAEARASGDRRHELLARRWLLHAATEVGDVARGGREAAAAMGLADELGLAVQQWITRVGAAAHQLVAGDLEEAERLSNEGLALGAVAEPETAVDFVSLLLWTLRWVQGRLGEISSLVEEVAATPGVDTARRLGLALTHADLGRSRAAMRILDELSASRLAELHEDGSWFIALAAMSEAAAAVGHRPAALLVRERLESHADRVAITAVTATGPVAHHLGLAAWTLGDHEAGVRALRDAIDLADSAGIPVFGARSRLALADRLMLAGDSGAARRLAIDARAAARSLGLRGVEQRSEAILQG